MTKTSRRQMLKLLATGAAGATLAACAPQVVTAVVTQLVPVPQTQVVQQTVQVPVVQTAVVTQNQVVTQVITATPAPRNPVTINWWQAPIWRYAPDNTTVVGAGSDAKGVDDVNRFQAKFPWITVKMELIPWAQWAQVIATGFASGAVANVIYSQQNAARVQSGLLEPLDDYLTSAITDNWLPGMKQSLTYFGRVYGVPWATNPQFTTFSQTSLDKFGATQLTTDVGADRSGVTFDLLSKYGQTYGDKKTRFFWGVPMDHGSILYWMFGAWLEGWGVQAWDATEERWQVADNPNSVKAMQWMLDAANAGVMPPAKSLPKWSDCDNFYWAGNMAGRLQWAGMQTELETAQAAGQAAKDFKLFFAAFPHSADVKAFASGMSPIAYNVGKTNDPAVREASFAYANWLSADDSNQVSTLVEGEFPATKSGLAVIANHPKLADPNIKWVVDTMTTFGPEITGGNWQPVINARSSQIMFAIQPDPFSYFVGQLQSMMLGQKTPAAMLKEIATKINTSLGAKV